MSATASSISAIMPVHNGATHLADGLRSILAQSQPVAEIIVVDDGSDDGSADLARALAPEIRVCTQSRQGPAAARNAGAAVAQGTFLAFLDHDDLWPADRTEKLLEGWRLDPLVLRMAARREPLVAYPPPGA